MLIHEVEIKTGLSKKSIRYYEDVGLFTPKRNHGNGYRTYTEEEVDLLRRIKFLRELDIAVVDLLKLKRKELSLADIMTRRMEKIEEYERNYQKIRLMCREMIYEEKGFENFDIDRYANELNILRKGGFQIMDVKKDHAKKIRGAVGSSVVFMALFIFIMGMITYFQITEEEKMPMVLYIFFMGIFLLPMVSIVVNLFSRIREIKGGEEDEASKY